MRELPAASGRMSRAHPPVILVTAVILIATSAVLLSFVRLGSKVYWHDEAYTSLRVFGHTGPEYYGMFDSRLHTVNELQLLQHADAALGISATLRALASRPEHTPLYFLLARAWAGLFDDPVVALRCLSAVFAMFTLPAVFWFTRELFGDVRISLVTVALVAVSPLHLLYAQEAREYALWGLLMMLSGAALLRALRTGARADFLLYAVSLVLGMYAHILFVLSIACHALYVAVLRKRYAGSTIRYFAIALVMAALAFVPWLLLFLHALPDITRATAWMHRPLSLAVLSWSWLVSINRLFFDFPGSTLLVPLSCVLALTAVFTLPRRTPPVAWLLPVLMLLIPAAVVIVPDLLDGGRRSQETRYLMPALLSLQLCVAWLIGSGMLRTEPWGRLAGGAATLLLAGGFASQLVILSASTWWNKSFSAGDAHVAALINAADRPLLVSTLGEVNPGELLTLSYFLQDKVALLLLRDAEWPQLPAGFDHCFVLNMPWQEAQAQAHGYTRYHVPGVNSLWELRRVPTGPSS